MLEVKCEEINGYVRVTYRIWQASEGRCEGGRTFYVHGRDEGRVNEQINQRIVRALWQERHAKM